MEALSRGIRFQRKSAGFDHERHRGQLDSGFCIIRFAGLPHGFERRYVGIVKICHTRHRRPRLMHLGGDGLADLGHLLDLNRTPLVGRGFSGTRR